MTLIRFHSFAFCLCIPCKPLCCNPHESSKPAKAASIWSVRVRLGYEGWNPCTCYLPCTSRTRCTHQCHSMWLCNTGKALQYTILLHHHHISCMIVYNCACSNMCCSPLKQKRGRRKVKLKMNHLNGHNFRAWSWHWIMKTISEIHSHNII